ncbi:MAG: DUF305 domain-containing protein [Acidimicrobiales bacterium]|nr:DUF305 domain-containing protein [Acidimicrobiales bacterium]
MLSRTFLAAGLVGLVGLVGAACSDDDDAAVESSPSEAAAEHNDADVTFAQGMIPHHRQAIEMAELAPDRAEDERVLDLAQRIESAQAPEIAEMTGWLEDWDEDVPAEGEGGHDEHDSGSGVSGMMTTEDMDSLEAASGAEFDQMFLTMMIEHHNGALDMAETEVEDGQFHDAIALAEAIIDAQESEIAEMQAILDEGGTAASTSSSMGMTG